MGSTSYSSDAWKTYASTAATKSVHEVFKKSAIDASLDPAAIVVRESRDSDVNPITTPIQCYLDVTGSMGLLAHQIASKGLGQIFEELLKRKVVPGPQFAFGGIGDVTCDRAPLQVSQFESDTASLTPQLEKLFLEGRGGGNSSESYNLPWYFTNTRVSHDAFEKRGKKGYLFTIGDEECPPSLTGYQLRKVFPDVQGGISNEQLLESLSESWHVFHIIVEQGSHMRNRYNADKVIASWQKVLGQRVLMLDDTAMLSEVIVSAIAVTEGDTVENVTSSWSGSTAVTVAKALAGSAVAKQAAATNGIVRL